jgi:hypothetical protein
MNKGGTNLAIEQRGDPNFILIHRLGYLLERHSLYFITPAMSSVARFSGFLYNTYRAALWHGKGGRMHQADHDW